MPEVKVGDFFCLERDLLLFVSPTVEPKSELRKEMSREGDDEGYVVQSTQSGFELAVCTFPLRDEFANVCGPSFEFVAWEEDRQGACVEPPSKNDLFFLWGAFGFEFWGGEETSSTDWLGVA